MNICDDIILIENEVDKLSSELDEIIYEIKNIQKTKILRLQKLSEDKSRKDKLNLFYKLSSETFVKLDIINNKIKNLNNQKRILKLALVGRKDNSILKYKKTYLERTMTCLWGLLQKYLCNIK